MGERPAEGKQRDRRAPPREGGEAEGRRAAGREPQTAGSWQGPSRPRGAQSRDGRRMAGWGAPAAPRALMSGSFWGSVASQAGGDPLEGHKRREPGQEGCQHPACRHLRPVALGSHVPSLLWVSRPFLHQPPLMLQGLLLIPPNFMCFQRKSGKQAMLLAASELRREGSSLTLCFFPETQTWGCLLRAGCPLALAQEASACSRWQWWWWGPGAEPPHPLSFLSPQDLPKAVSQTPVLRLIHLAPCLPQRAVCLGSPHPLGPQPRHLLS